MSEQKIDSPVTLPPTGPAQSAPQTETVSVEEAPAPVAEPREDAPEADSQIEQLDTDFLTPNDDEADIPDHMPTTEGQEAAPQPAEEAPKEAAPADVNVKESPPTEPPTPVEQAQPTDQPPQQPEGQPQAAPTTAPVEPQEPQAPETPTPPTPEVIQNQRAEWRANAEKELASKHFTVSDELVAEFDENPAGVMSKLMSKTYLDAVEGSVYAIASMLPQVIQSVQGEAAVADKHEAEFYDRWPMIDKSNPQHAEAVRQHVVNFRHVNPKASAKEVIDHAGAAAVIALKLPFDPPAQAAPQQPMQAAPHRPVGAGAPGAPESVSKPSNPFEQLYEDAEALENDL